MCVGKPELAVLRGAGGARIPAAEAAIYGTVEMPNDARWLINGGKSSLNTGHERRAAFRS